MNKTIQRLVETQGAYRGNVFSDLQLSAFIRPAHATRCNGTTFEPGALRAFDLKMFRRRFGFAAELAESHPERECVLCVWRTPKDTMGATLTDVHGHMLGMRTAPGKGARSITVARRAMAELQRMVH